MTHTVCFFYPRILSICPSPINEVEQKQLHNTSVISTHYHCHDCGTHYYHVQLSFASTVLSVLYDIDGFSCRPQCKTQLKGVFK